MKYKKTIKEAIDFLKAGNTEAANTLFDAVLSAKVEERLSLIESQAKKEAFKFLENN